MVKKKTHPPGPSSRVTRHREGAGSDAWVLGVLLLTGLFQLLQNPDQSFAPGSTLKIFKIDPI